MILTIAGICEQKMNYIRLLGGASPQNADAARILPGKEVSASVLQGKPKFELLG
jgi:hypothetical protein